MSDFQFSPISTKTVNIEGMTCGHCKVKVENAISKLENVSEVEVDLIDASAEISFTSNLDLSEVEKVVREAGFKLK